MYLRQALKNADASVPEVNDALELTADKMLGCIANVVFQHGRHGAAEYQASIQRTGMTPPLMWRWHGKRYLGAGHGLGTSIHQLGIQKSKRIQLASFTFSCFYLAAF